MNYNMFRLQSIYLADMSSSFSFLSHARLSRKKMEIVCPNDDIANENEGGESRYVHVLASRPRS